MGDLKIGVSLPTTFGFDMGWMTPYIVPIGFTTWAGYQPWILGYVWKMPKHVFASKSCVLDDVRGIYIYTNTTIIYIYMSIFYVYIYIYVLHIYIYILYIHLDMYMILDILHIWYTVHRVIFDAHPMGPRPLWSRLRKSRGGDAVLEDLGPPGARKISCGDGQNRFHMFSIWLGDG